ncbi:hypothetical protein [Calycomorphotria hydatis]|uniref:3-keto-disaccharide hydrolase domain-containing protein n=1 Tax=Calycomorphotria hydatis TaxID=2528027 RepID=A0A517T792_9PLAN|nr:hypothetical protein [Calycomorphotria hydatis]QDT64242.1 hypothetical protein V22_14730 [Calycomorphotria hydatis]
MKIRYLAFAVLMALFLSPVDAEEKNSLICYEDFSDFDTVAEEWRPYVKMADGKWARGFEDLAASQPAGREAWWVLEDGVMRGQNFPDEDHPLGLGRPKPLPKSLEKTGMRVSWRVKVQPTSEGTLRVFGKSAGVIPDEKTDNNVTAVVVSTDGLKLWKGRRFLVEDVADKADRKFSNSKFDKESDVVVAPDVWHDLSLELQQNHAKVYFDGELAIDTELPTAQPFLRVGVQVNGDKKSVGVVWWDDIRIESLPSAE